MRRRDFTLGLLLATAARSVRAQERAKQNRIAIITPAGPVAVISDTGLRGWPAFFEELRRLGDVEGQNLIVERYSGEGRPESYADLAREVVSSNPDVDRLRNQPRRAGGPRGHWDNADRLDWGRADPARTRDEPGAALAATSLASPARSTSKSGGSGCRFSRKPSLSVSKVAFVSFF